MDKNLLLAVTLSLAVYAIWFGVIEKRVLPVPPPTRPGISAPVPSAPPNTRETVTAPAAEPVVDKEAALKAAESVTFGNANALISPRGASIVKWEEKEALGIVGLVDDPRPGFFATFPELTFRRDANGEGLVYKARRPDGVVVTKEFVPEGPKTLPRIKITLENTGGSAVESGAWTLSIGPGLGTIETEKAENPKVWRAVGLEAGKKKAEDFKPGEHRANWRWVGVDNRYFLAAAIPAPGDFEKVESSQPPLVVLSAKSVTLEAKASRTWEVPYYLGAKGFRWLAHYDADLDRAINFGIFHPIGRGVLTVLLRLHDATGNFGWSIIILTILLQLLLFPFTFQSLKSMAKMRRLQPEIARLQQRYAKDQTRLSQETMELYKKEGANPLGGCLPMLMQMPVFYALYNALRNAWELHGAVWIFWVKDLSAKDPFYVLPLIMGGVMFLQNKLNAQQTADPAQAQMMTWMPVIFTFMFLKFPAGLVLYWLTNSIVSTTQQIALKGYLDPKPGVRR
ncbi:MAG: membrane protein insertase YidC [Elusimicrobia bacterium]|nr:membrane protein insertase YidC [Elusimicrobiota bacterium]